MKIQTASIDVPGGCPNKCRFCVSEITRDRSHGMLENVIKDLTDTWIVEQYLSRLEYLRDQGVDTLIFTGSASEPMWNLDFVEKVGDLNNLLPSRFKNIEIQTSGICIDYKNLIRLDNAGIKTISLSLSSLDSKLNAKISGIPEPLQYDIKDICLSIKESGFNLRLSLNMNKQGFSIEVKKPENLDHLFQHISNDLKADQVTFRKLYGNHNTKQGNWIEENKIDDSSLKYIESYITNNGHALNRLAFGAIKYDVYGVSAVIDTDCMAEKTNETLKYAILRRNCKLYSDWQSPASLIF